MKEYLLAIQQGKKFSRSEAAALMLELLKPESAPEQVAAVIFALSVRGETAKEVLGFVDVLRQQMQILNINKPVLDTCGTGGDNAKTFNISTAVALVCAAYGLPVVKHGNVAISSQSGSADCLAALHIPTQLVGPAAVDYYNQHNFIFAFAPLYHPALKKLGPIRRALQVKTIFNYLGPLLNPAQPAFQLIGVTDLSKAKLLAEVLLQNGVKHAVIVHSQDGLDEISIAVQATVLDCTDAGIKEFIIEPKDFLPTNFNLADITVESAQASANIIKDLAAGKSSSAAYYVVVLNAGMALYAANQVENYSAGVKAIDNFLRTSKFADYLSTL